MKEFENKKLKPKELIHVFAERNMLSIRKLRDFVCFCDYDMPCRRCFAKKEGLCSISSDGNIHSYSLTYTEYEEIRETHPEYFI